MTIMLDRILSLLNEKPKGASKELADYLGIRASVVTDWKGGRNKSYTKYAPLIADYYGVSLDWLSGMSDERIKKSASSVDKADDETIARINAELEDMSKDDLLKVLAMIEVIKK